MSEEEIKNLRMRLYELTNTNTALQEENHALQSRISELYSWSQQTQDVIRQCDVQIQMLNVKLNSLKQREQKRLQTRSEVTLGDLYQQVQHLEVNKRELLEQ